MIKPVDPHILTGKQLETQYVVNTLPQEFNCVKLAHFQNGKIGVFEDIASLRLPDQAVIAKYKCLDDAIHDVLTEKLASIIVSGISEDYKACLFCCNLQLIEGTLFSTYDIILAIQHFSNVYGTKLFYPFHFRHFLSEVNGRFGIALSVSSPAEAAAATAEQVDSVCITNAENAEKYGLKSFKTLRKQFINPFFVFKKAQNV